MKEIKQKIINKLVPTIIKTAIVLELQKYNGKYYGQMGNCPECNHKESYKNHIDENKIFCKLIIDTEIEDVIVKIQYFTCKKCGRVHRAIDAPFYKGMRYADIIADMIMYYCDHPYNEIEKIMMDYGIQIDRDTIRRYFILLGRHAHKESENMRFQKSKETRTADILKLIFGTDDVEDILKKTEACADETYPTKKGEKKKWRKKNKELKREGKKEKLYPKGFTLAMAYLTRLKLFNSLVISVASFNRNMAEVLLNRLENAIYVLTDQHKAYDTLITRHINCFIHKFRNAMKKYDKKKKYPENYFKKEYEKFCNKLKKTLKKEHKELFNKKGEFIGEALTTNAIEGGNWRIKYKLKTLYSNVESIFGRTVCILIKESIYTFRNGLPTESFAHKNSNFKYANILLT